MSSGIKILADENIPFVKEAFGTIGTVKTISGRKITNNLLKDIDVLLVRSITRVDEKLLSGTNVKIVATATIGTDHIDIEYLQAKGISFAYAPGCNANSVAEYLILALLSLACRKQISLKEKTIGIIGVGNVGSKVAHKCSALGLNILKNDPPLKDKTGSDEFIELDNLIQNSDIITLHVPLTATGKYPTYHMVDTKFLEKIKPNTILINTSRGAVVDNKALKNTIKSGKLLATCLDVWENEPNIDTDLLKIVDIGTPHIAGYSLDGKIKGTEMIYQSVCKFLNIKPIWSPHSTSLPLPTPTIEIYQHYTPIENLLFDKLSLVYDIESDDKQLRKILDLPPVERGKYFDKLRKQYPVRREFFNTKVKFSETIPENIRNIFYEIGFQAD